MILILGGTTEGKTTAALLDQLDESYLYSTKTRVRQQVKGEMIEGALDEKMLIQLCGNRNIKLLLDASHPFAEVLHRTVSNVARTLGIPSVRIERNYLKLEENDQLRLFGSYDELLEAIRPCGWLNPVLAMTGVQTIDHLKPIWTSRMCFFRILDTEHSRQLATASGIDPEWLVSGTPAIEAEELRNLIRSTGARLLLTKESGESGYFNLKQKIAREMHVPLWVVRRPVLPDYDYMVDSEKELLQLIYRLQKDQLRRDERLREGFTTGSGITACAQTAFIALMTGQFPTNTTIVLPDDTPVYYPVFPCFLESCRAACVVVKDSGDDPDVTHGEELGCEIRLTDKPGKISFKQGKGIGCITLDGLPVPVGEPAINPIPREMMIFVLQWLCAEYEWEGGLEVVPFIPNGEELARRTFNPRVGVVGGLSVLGTTGHLKPFSAEAFLHTIREQIQIALTNHCERIVATSGKRSETLLKPVYCGLPDYAFIHYGNMVGDMLILCKQMAFRKITVGMMLGKAIKLAEGHLNTHSKKTRFHPDFVVQLARECGHPKSVLEQMQELVLANAIPSLIPWTDEEPFYRAVADHARTVCRQVVGRQIELEFILIREK